MSAASPPAWLRTRIAHAQTPTGWLVICPGTQTALFALLAALTTAGDIVLTETLTYPGMKAAASPIPGHPARRGRDRCKDGMVPQALAERLPGAIAPRRSI